MSVVGSNWEALKRFNLHELYQPSPNVKAASGAEAKPQRVTTNDAATPPIFAVTDSSEL